MHAKLLGLEMMESSWSCDLLLPGYWLRAVLIDSDYEVSGHVSPGNPSTWHMIDGYLTLAFEETKHPWMIFTFI